MIALPLEAVLFVFLLVIGIVVGRQRDLFGAAMLTGIFSFLSAGLFVLMNAVDVAFTEAAVGAGISTVLILATLSLTEDTEKPSPRSWVAIGVVSLTAFALLVGTFDMPAYADPNAPIHHGVAKHYLERSWAEIGLPNVVTSVLASYRGFDTFGELGVVFTAGIGVTLILRSKRAVMGADAKPIPQRSRAPYVREMPIVRAVAKVMLPFILLFALYVQAHGDFGPGGGFQAGVIFAAGLVLYGLVWGPRARCRSLRANACSRPVWLRAFCSTEAWVCSPCSWGTDSSIIRRSTRTRRSMASTWVSSWWSLA